MRTLDAFGKYILVGGVAIALLAPLNAAHAKGFSVLYSFTGGSSDGAYPSAGLIRDSAGNLYGTTEEGGAHGIGTVFTLAPDGTETVLHAFAWSRDGARPRAGLKMDTAGNLYGTTNKGGGSGKNSGTVFKLAPDGTLTVLHVFTRGSDGARPYAGLIMDTAGNLYGTTEDGGGTPRRGVVFELAPDGTETVLHSFTARSGGGVNPVAGLIKDSAGNLYGTTERGDPRGGGVVFELAPDGTETVLHAFTGGSDGATPVAGLIKDSAGNLYGTTERGGGSGDCSYGCGTVFKLAPNGTETVLYAFSGIDGAAPVAGLIKDTAGNLYGTTEAGGGNGYGVVFELAPDGAETALHSFTGGSDGAAPVAGLIKDTAGNLYGTTSFGGNGYGVVFKVNE